MDVRNGENNGVVLRQATSSTDLAAVAQCFKDYTQWLDEDLTFQNYEAELNELPGKYAPPTGTLLLAVDPETDAILGCVALRPLELHGEYKRNHSPNMKRCELKRLYVYPAARGKQVARRLIHEALQRAKSGGYDEVFLDTMTKMKPAIQLYKSEGFVEIEPYCHSPLDCKFFSKNLGATPE